MNWVVAKVDSWTHQDERRGKAQGRPESIQKDIQKSTHDQTSLGKENFLVGLQKSPLSNN